LCSILFQEELETRISSSVKQLQFQDDVKHVSFEQFKQLESSVDGSELFISSLSFFYSFTFLFFHFFFFTDFNESQKKFQKVHDDFTHSASEILLLTKDMMDFMNQLTLHQKEVTSVKENMEFIKSSSLDAISMQEKLNDMEAATHHHLKQLEIALNKQLDEKLVFIKLQEEKAEVNQVKFMGDLEEELKKLKDLLVHQQQNNGDAAEVQSTVTHISQGEEVFEHHLFTTLKTNLQNEVYILQQQMEIKGLELNQNTIDLMNEKLAVLNNDLNEFEVILQKKLQLLIQK
jgi:hypothetical protein